MSQVRKFHRKRGPRKLFRQGLAHNLIMKGRISTTTARAKEIRPMVERLVTIAKGGQTADLRLLRSRLPVQSAQKLYYEIAPKYKERKGGYLRIVKTSSTRKRDGAPVTMIEFV